MAQSSPSQQSKDQANIFIFPLAVMLRYVQELNHLKGDSWTEQGKNYYREDCNELSMSESGVHGIFQLLWALICMKRNILQYANLNWQCIWHPKRAYAPGSLLKMFSKFWLIRHERFFTLSLNAANGSCSLISPHVQIFELTNPTTTTSLSKLTPSWLKWSSFAFPVVELLSGRCLC